jgi:DNA-directed RNA polymerase specialized sigma24 family protein
MTDHQRNKIVVQMYTIDRASIASIAKAVRCSPSNVYRILKVKRTKLRGMHTLSTIAKNPDVQQRHRKTLGKSPNHEALERARALVEQGQTYKVAAETCGVTRSMVAGHMFRRKKRKRLGLTY